MTNVAAVDGGRPLRLTPLRFHIPLIEDDDVAAVSETLRSGWLTTGETTRKFEAAIAEFCGVPHALAVNSGTAALHLALEAVGVGSGDEVLLPTYTFAATGEVVSYLNAIPVLVDCDGDGFNMSLEDARRRLTPRTKAIIIVHIAGLPCDLPAFAAFAQEAGISLIEDAAHSLPGAYDGAGVGQISDAAALSFYATKNITTGEGGMLLTRRKDVAERARIMCLHGISKDAWKRYTQEGSWRYDILSAGFKYNLTDIASALGLSQLAKSAHMLGRRSAIAARYDAAFSSIRGLMVPPRDTRALHSWHLYILRVLEDQLTVGRDRFLEALKAEGILGSVHFIPLHMHSHYMKSLGVKEGDFPNAERHFRGAMSLPLYPKMSDTDVSDVIAAVLKLVDIYRR